MGTYRDLVYEDDVMNRFRSTTILCVRQEGKVVMAGDGQVTLNNSVMKHGAKKIRKIFKENVVAGFAGSAADSFALFSRFESKLEEYNGNLERAAVELARDWRTDRALRRLEALMIVADKEKTYLISGTGDLIEPDDGILAIGSGGTAALAAAKALVCHATGMTAEGIATEALKIAAEIDVYTNSNIITVVL
jgi:ATP-dependent HslUV protease subunit HslV